MTAIEQYQVWYYSEAAVWTKTTFLGVPCLKSVSDMWNYQEILTELQPSLIVEFGTYYGGSALYFAEIARRLVLTVDIDHTPVHDSVRHHPLIRLLQADTTSPEVVQHIRQLRIEYGGKVFFIVDSDHHKQHVFSELVQLRSVTKPGDYVVVEDGIVNGHPVLPDWGPGPFEALQEYQAQYPDDYRSDREREYKFGFTFAPGGFLLRL